MSIEIQLPNVSKKRKTSLLDSNDVVQNQMESIVLTLNFNQDDVTEIKEEVKKDSNISADSNVADDERDFIQLKSLLDSAQYAANFYKKQFENAEKKLLGLQSKFEREMNFANDRIEDLKNENILLRNAIIGMKEKLEQIEKLIDKFP